MPFSLADVELHCLENGLKVLIQEDHSVPIVTSMIWYRVGSRDESPGLTGVSHFIEHMLFKGTDALGKGAIDWMTAVNGGFNNAFTAHDYTAYYFSFASDRWLAALEVEADRMSNTVFDPEEFELEREVILEEWRMGMDNPWEAMRDALDRRAYPSHPYGNPVIGCLEDLKTITIPAMTAFYRRHYCPSNSMLVLVGDFNSGETLQRVQDLYGTIPPGSPVSRNPIPIGRVRIAEPFTIESPTSLGRLLVALPAPSVTAGDLDCYLVLEKLLSQGKLGRLYRRLVEETELVSFVEADFEESWDPYQLLLRMELREGVKVETVLGEVYGIFEGLIEGRISEADVERAKNQLRTEFYEDFESTFDRAFLLGLYGTLDRWQSLDNLMARVENVGRSDLAATAARYCSPADALACYLLPQGAHD